MKNIIIFTILTLCFSCKTTRGSIEVTANRKIWPTGLINDIIQINFIKNNVEIEDVLIGQQVWHNWKYNIIISYNNATENNVPDLFINWGNF